MMNKHKKSKLTEKLSVDLDQEQVIFNNYLLGVSDV